METKEVIKMAYESLGFGALAYVGSNAYIAFMGYLGSAAILPANFKIVAIALGLFGGVIKNL